MRYMGALGRGAVTGSDAQYHGMRLSLFLASNGERVMDRRRLDWNGVGDNNDGTRACPLYRVMGCRGELQLRGRMREQGKECSQAGASV